MLTTAVDTVPLNNLRTKKAATSRAKFVEMFTISHILSGTYVTVSFYRLLF